MPWAFAGATLVVVAVASASTPRDELLREAGRGSAFDVAGAVDRVGDAAWVELLADPEAPVDLRLVAVRGAAFLDAPQAAVPPLAALAATRDPDIAPEAVAALLAIARRAPRLQTLPERAASSAAARDLAALATDPALPANLAASLGSAASMLAAP